MKYRTKVHYRAWFLPNLE